MRRIPTIAIGWQSPTLPQQRCPVSDAARTATRNLNRCSQPGEPAVEPGESTVLRCPRPSS
eukprot:12632490-Alexandrium_andersonii.AAC.1